VAVEDDSIVAGAADVVSESGQGIQGRRIYKETIDTAVALTAGHVKTGDKASAWWKESRW